MAQKGDSRVKLLISYDVNAETQQEYYEFVLREFIPRLQALGLVMSEAWHTAYGHYPLRMAGFIAPDRTMLQHVLKSPEYQEIEEQFKRYVTNIEYKILPYREGFQF